MSTAYLEAAKQIVGDLAEELAADIHRADAILKMSLRSDCRRVEDIGNHTFEAGGKRLRPLFVSLGARATGREYDADRVAALGACMEMIHMATLIHDDVVDGADVRRGRPTASAVHGNTASILCGDVMLARAMELLASDGDLELIRMVSKTVVEMATGEIMEVEARGDFDLGEAAHLEILRRKTATFIAACCKGGAIIAGGDNQTQQALADYGEAVGMGFQIADDLIDFRSSSEVSGKPRASDFREGCATLPLILLRPKLGADELLYLRSKFGNGVVEADLDTIGAWMSEREAFGGAESMALEFANSAQRALEPLENNGPTAMLSKLADLLIRRDY